MKIYIAGACGAFMAGLARLAVEAGHSVRGCDAKCYPPMSEQLAELGVALDDDWARARPGREYDCIVIGNALSRGNPLVEHVLRERLPMASGPAWLRRHILRDRQVVAIAGTHGKTTTAAMTAWLLERAGLAPGFLCGGVPRDFGVSARLGAGPFVIEADEYDTAFFDKRSKFVHYAPDILALNNLEFDHADIFDDLAAIERQFAHLLRLVPDNGRVLYRREDARLREVLARGLWTPCESFGLADDADWRVAPDGDDCRLQAPDGTRARFRLCVPGAHNMLNALAALAAATHAGAPLPGLCEALAEFGGVSRRLELKLRAETVRVYDDFAHHPTEIRASLAAIREEAARNGGERIVAVFEPASNTMRAGVHNAALAGAFDAADRVYFYRPQAAAACAAPAHPAVRDFDDAGALFDALRAEARAGGFFVVMSNRGFDGLSDRLARALADGEARP